MAAVSALLFDLNGTLTDPAGLGSPWDAPELGTEILATAIESAMAETLFGAYHEFKRHIESALLTTVRRHELEEEPIEQSLERAQELEPFPDVRPGLERLADAGHRLAVLTNSGAASGRHTLEAAGLDGHFELILGVDAVRVFKPHPDTYAHALEQLGNPPPESVMLVAAHAWDIAGAKHAGLRGAFVRRSAEAVPAVFPKPDLDVADLHQLAAEVDRGHGAARRVATDPPG